MRAALSGVGSHPTTCPRDPVEDLVTREDVRAGLLLHIRCELARLATGRHRRTIEDTVQEIFQETTLRALLRKSTYRSGNTGLAWLKRIATNILLNERRRARHPARPCCGDGRFDEAAGTLPAAGGDDPTTIWEVVDRLEPPYRRVVLLCFRQGLSGRSLAEEIGVPSAKAATDLKYRALRKLRAALGLNTPNRAP